MHPPAALPPRRLPSATARAALVIAGVIVLAVLLWFGRGALTPFIIGAVLIYILDPLVRRLHDRGVPAALAVLLVYVLALAALIGGLGLLLRPLIEQVADFVGNLPQLLAAIDQQLRVGLGDVYERFRLPPGIRDAIDRAIRNATAGGGGEGFGLGSLLSVAGAIRGVVTSMFGYLIVPVWAFYILKDRDRLLASVDRALPAEWRSDAWAILRMIERVFGRWLRSQVFLGVIVGLATFLGLLALGQFVDARFFRFAVLLAVIAGVFELLPIVGPILSMIPALLIAATVSPQAMLGVLVLYLVVQQIENNVLVPKIQGEAIELHPSVVIFALVVGGAIAGLLGAIFALPVTAAGRDVFRYLFHRADPGRDPRSAHEVVGLPHGPPDAARHRVERQQLGTPRGGGELDERPIEVGGSSAAPATTGDVTGAAEPEPSTPSGAPDAGASGGREPAPAVKPSGPESGGGPGGVSSRGGSGPTPPTP